MAYTEFELYQIALNYQPQAVKIVRKQWGYTSTDHIPSCVQAAFNKSVESMCVELFESEAQSIIAKEPQ